MTSPPLPAQPPQRSASPNGSFYALSDDDEGEYNTVTHTETGRGVKLLYSKSKVSTRKEYDETDEALRASVLVQPS